MLLIIPVQIYSIKKKEKGEVYGMIAIEKAIHQRPKLKDSNKVFKKNSEFRIQNLESCNEAFTKISH